MNINTQNSRVLTRDSNIELLRCLLMFMIVIVHFTGHNIMSAANPVQLGEKNWWAANFLESFSECAVNCFVIISGFYGIKISLKKIVLFLLPILFYELVISIIYFGTYHHISFSPFHYWFVRVFFALMLISPLLNKSLALLSKKQIQIILLLLLVFFVLPPISYISGNDHCISGNHGKNLLIFVILYVIGYYLRNHFIAKKPAWFYFLVYLILGSFLLFETFLLAKVGYYKGSSSLSYNYDNFLIVGMAVCLFLFFSKLNIKSKVVNWIAGSSFFVYIISENQFVYKSPYGLYDLINANSWNTMDIYPIKVISYALLVFFACIMIDKVRTFLFSGVEKKIGDLIDNYTKKHGLEI